MQQNKHENMRIMMENVALIKEINQLRKQIRNMKQSQQELAAVSYFLSNDSL